MNIEPETRERVKARFSSFSHDALLELVCDLVEASARQPTRTDLRTLLFRACLNCEGRGTIREYINVAGNFNIHHCPECDGTGKEKDTQ